MDETHEKLIEELFDTSLHRLPIDFAARNETMNLRARAAELEKKLKQRGGSLAQKSDKVSKTSEE